MRALLLRSALALAAASAGASLARADEVLLTTGERLVGKVLAADGGKLTFKSDTAGTVALDFEKIRSFSADEPIEIRFKDGTVLVQKVKLADDGAIAIEQEGVVAAQSFPIGQIAKINPPPVKWSGAITAGYQATRGNSKTDSANVDIAASRRGENDRITFKAYYAGAQQRTDASGQDESTVRAGGGSLQYDYFFSKKFYGLGFAKAQTDGIANLDLRFQTGVGVGYQWVETDRTKFNTEAGITWVSETVTNVTTNPTPPPAELKEEETTSGVGARVAYNFEKKLGAASTFFHSAEWFPGFERARDHFVTTTTGIRTSLTKAMIAEAKTVVEWDSTPAEGAERTNTRYVLGLGWSF